MNTIVGLTLHGQDGQDQRFKVEREEETKPKAIRRIPNQINVQDFFPDDSYNELMAGGVDASEYIQMAVDRSWRWVVVQYSLWAPREGVDYPLWEGSKRAWGASSGAVAIPVVLPPASLRCDKPIDLPSCVPLVAPAGTFAGAEIVFGGNAGLRVLGNLRIKGSSEPFQMLRGEVRGVKLISDGGVPLSLCGDIANWRFVNNHLHLVSKDVNGIDHIDWAGTETRYGKLLGRQGIGGQTLKKVVIRHNQIEGPKGGNAINISGAFDCQVNANLILYAGLGIRAANCDRLTIAGNRFNSDRPGEDIEGEEWRVKL